MSPTARVEDGIALLVRESVSANRTSLPTCRQQIISICKDMPGAYVVEDKASIVRLENPNREESLVLVLRVMGKRRPHFRMLSAFFPGGLLSEQYPLPPEASEFGIRLKV